MKRKKEEKDNREVGVVERRRDYAKETKEK